MWRTYLRDCNIKKHDHPKFTLSLQTTFQVPKTLEFPAHFQDLSWPLPYVHVPKDRQHTSEPWDGQGVAICGAWKWSVHSMYGKPLPL